MIILKSDDEIELTSPNKWTVVTKDGNLSAHYGNTYLKLIGVICCCKVIAV